MWWDRDNVAQHILMSHLGQLPCGVLPPLNISTRTALSIYQTMTKYYGTCSFADCTELLNSLHNSSCTPGRVSDYVTKWWTGLSRLQSARFVFNVKICISLFVRGLPLVSAFTIIRATLPDRLAGITEFDLGPFISLTETVLDLDTIFRSASQSQGSRSNRPPAPVLLPQPTPGSSSGVSSSSAVGASDPASRFTKPSLTCGNCKSRGLRCTGHTDATCFQPGGGMEGRREEYLSNKGRFHAMFVECLDNASLSSDNFIPPDPPPPALSPSLPYTLDDDVVLAPLANLCVPTFSPNTDFDFDLYHLRDRSSSLSHFAFSTFDFSTSALASVIPLYNALLDSGCTHHIVRDRALFSTYVSSPVSVGTANCGSLEALGTGDVSFRYPYRDRHVLFTLRGCLYAPAAPINLLSVGALVERGMSCLFSPGGITKVFFSGDHPLLPGLEFCATVANHLSFLKVGFFIPPSFSFANCLSCFGSPSGSSCPLTL